MSPSLLLLFTEKLKITTIAYSGIGCNPSHYLKWNWIWTGVTLWIHKRCWNLEHKTKCWKNSAGQAASVEGMDEWCFKSSSFYRLIQRYLGLKKDPNPKSRLSIPYIDVAGPAESCTVRVHVYSLWYWTSILLLLTVISNISTGTCNTLWN